MNRDRALVLLTSAAIVASGTIHAQARTPAPKAPRLEPRIARKIDSTDRCNVAGLLGQDQGATSCYASDRSRAAALAWSRGLDEHGIPLDAGARTRKLTEMESWLRRLAGTFRIEGTYKNHGGTSQLHGTAKCSSIGSGPGTSCIVTATWKAPRESFKNPEFDKALYNAMQSLGIILGIDPAASQIRGTLTDYRALKIRGFLVDDEVAFSGESLFEHDAANPLVPNSWAASLIAIQPDGGVDMRFAMVPTSVDYRIQGSGMLRGQILLNRGIEFRMRLLRVGP